MLAFILYPLFVLTMLVGLFHAYALVLVGKSEPELWLKVSDVIAGSKYTNAAIFERRGKPGFISI